MAEQPPVSTPRQRLLEARIMDANVVYGPEADENKVNGPRESAEEGFSKAHGRSKNSDPKEDKKSQLSAEVAPHLVPPPPPVVSNDEMPDAYDSSYIDSLTTSSAFALDLVAAADNALADLSSWRAAQRRSEAELEAAAHAKLALQRAHAATASAAAPENDGMNEVFWEGASRDALTAAADARERLALSIEASTEASRLRNLNPGIGTPNALGSDASGGVDAETSSSCKWGSSSSANTTGSLVLREAECRPWSPSPSTLLADDERARARAQAQAAEELELAAGGDLRMEAEGLSEELAELNAALAELDESSDDEDGDTKSSR